MMVTLRFSGGRGIEATLVKAATWSWCSHVDFVLPDGRLLGAVPGRGVCIREVEFDDVRVELYGVERPRLVYHEMALQFAHTQVGRPYDWAGVLGWGMRRDWQEADSWFCSELVAWSFEKAGFPLLRANEVWRITPRDLLMSPFLIPISGTWTAPL